MRRGPILLYALGWPGERDDYLSSFVAAVAAAGCSCLVVASAYDDDGAAAGVVVASVRPTPSVHFDPVDSLAVALDDGLGVGGFSCW